MWAVRWQKWIGVIGQCVSSALDMGTDEVRAFLLHWAVSCNVAASTQNQALNAVVFLYREVLK